MRIGAVAGLWSLVGGAAVCGWMVGKHDATREYSELQRRLTASTHVTRACGAEFELLDLRRENGIVPPPARADEDGFTQIAAPSYLHLRSLLTAR